MGKIKWQLLITREVCLLERYLRVLGYRNQLFPGTKVGVKNLLGVGRNGLMEVYDEPVDRARRFNLLKREFRMSGMKIRREKYFKKTLCKLKESQRILLKNKDYSSFRNFVKYYKYSRSIVWYAFELGKLMRKRPLFVWAGHWHHVSEIETCRAWDRSLPFFKHLAKKINVPVKDIFFYTPYEFIDLLRSGKRISKEIVNIRKNQYILLCLRGKISILTGKKCEEYLKRNLPQKSTREINIINGICGYKGKVKGRVRIVNKTAQAYQLKKGEILVSTMTAPRLSRAFRFAKAFVTDEGGITCHAAIVSRELKIPCVVGTKIATQVLKDGDFVEVDADRGIVKKI